MNIYIFLSYSIHTLYTQSSAFQMHPQLVRGLQSLNLFTVMTLSPSLRCHPVNRSIMLRSSSTRYQDGFSWYPLPGTPLVPRSTNNSFVRSSIPQARTCIKPEEVSILLGNICTPFFKDEGRQPFMLTPIYLSLKGLTPLRLAAELFDCLDSLTVEATNLSSRLALADIVQLVSLQHYGKLRLYDDVS